MKIFLLGLPGSGKTTLGKELAGSLGIPFVDLDSEIEKAEGMTIKEIFKTKKEAYFRQAESTHLKEWCTPKSSFVMATGGGTPCFFDNLEVINHCGKSIFLDVPAKEIAKRIMTTGLSERPLFANTHLDGLKDRIEFMRSMRLSFYSSAHFTLSGAAIDSRDLLEKIKKENRR